MRAFTEEKSVTLGWHVNYLALYIPSHVAGKKAGRCVFWIVYSPPRRAGGVGGKA